MQVRISLLLSALVILITSTFGATAQDGRGQSTEMQRQLEKAVENAYSPGEPGAVVIVTRGENTLLRTAIGVADLELDVALSPDMIFRTGSITKQFTAAAIMKLEDQGRLSVDDVITKHLPDYPTQGRTVTIRHLLNHTSGISMAHMHTRQDVNTSELLGMFKDEPFMFEPGEQLQYSNNNYNILGVIIEKISGKSYADFLNEEFFEPLGMEDTSFDDYSQIIERRAKGYQGSGDDIQNASFVSMSVPYAAGAVMSSLDDMVLWNRALFGGKVMSRASFEKMTTSTVSTATASEGMDHGMHDGAFGDYAFGLFVKEIAGHSVFEHGGAIEGFLAFNIYVPDEELSIVILQNTTGKSGLRDLATQLTAIALGVEEDADR